MRFTKNVEIDGIINRFSTQRLTKTVIIQKFAKLAATPLQNTTAQIYTQLRGIMQSHVVREHAQIPDDQNIMICIAMGYPNDDFPANHVRSVRADNGDFVKYIGFEDS